METTYGARYRDLYTRHWWWRARERLLLGELRRRRPASGWRAILDVGCGDGLFLDRLAELGDVVEGVEPAAALVSAAAARRWRIHIAPFDARFQPGRRYSLVLMLDVLEHLADPRGALRHAMRLLEPGGLFVATVPAFPALWTAHDDVNHHHTRYTRRTFGALAAGAGLCVAHERYFFQWTCPAKLAVRLAERLGPGAPRPARVPPRWINEPLYLLSRLEAETIGRLPVPFGSSLLAIGTPRAVSASDAA